MRIKFEIELRRPARRSVALLLGLLLLAVPAVALANHQFPDVPTGHPFHNEIGAIAEAGITAGFGDGGYHPSDPVTRQAMAAFMYRGFGRVGLAAGTAPMTSSVTVAAGSDSSNPTLVRQVTVTVPGASNTFSPNQLVHLQGRVSLTTTMSNTAKGCPCEFLAVIVETASGLPSFGQNQTFESASSFPFAYSFDVEGIFTAPPGPHTYQLEVGLVTRNSTMNATSFALGGNSSLSAMTFPFGPAGTNDIMPPN